MRLIGSQPLRGVCRYAVQPGARRLGDTAFGGNDIARNVGVPPASRLPAQDSTRPLAGVQILVVEDHADSRDFLEETLTYYGAVVVAVASATEAMRVVARVTPSIIIADIAMPFHDGVWLLKELRQHQAVTGRYVPVVALTASVSRPLKVDFDAVLIKPCPIDTVCRVIQRLTNAEPQPQERRA
jgi:CheY-like chemotaxis protein